MPLEKLAFVVPDVLAGCKFPSTDADIAEIATRRFKTLVTLTETSHPLAHKLTQLGVEAVHVPISDFSPPSPSNIQAVFELVRDKSKHPMLFHCHLGAGRTGTMLACALVGFYLNGDEFVHSQIGEKLTAAAVLEYQRKSRPESILTTRQIRFFEDWVDSGKAAQMFAPPQQQAQSSAAMVSKH